MTWREAAESASLWMLFLGMLAFIASLPLAPYIANYFHVAVTILTFCYICIVCHIFFKSRSERGCLG